ICRIYRLGYRIVQSELLGVQQSIVGILYTRKSDEKLRRWALNALARCGTAAVSLECVMGVFKEFSSDPQTAAAAIAAIYRMKRDATKAIDDLDLFDPQMRVLAALQHVEHTKLDLTGIPVDIEKASADVLKLGLIVVGLNRAPHNLFHPRHSNSEIVKALGAYDDDIVVQYTVWAVAENDNLSIDDLGIPLSSVESRPPNVRGWMYRAIAMHANAADHQDYIANGAGDDEAEVRLALAIGLKDTYYDGLEALAHDWFMTEADSEIAHTLMDHMVRHADRSPTYECTVLDFYEREAQNSLLRRRIEGHAAKTELYSKLMRISFDGSDDLFRSINVTNNTTNISGGINAGAVSMGGDATNTGEINVNYQPQTIELIQAELSKAIKAIHDSGVAPELKEHALEHVKAAQIEPTPDKLKKAVDVLGKVEDGAKKISGISTAAVAIGTTAIALAKLMGYVP
ncbi:hypothetical protein, partial [Mesorhizobium sp. M7A.F.Ca.CA.002.03.2.1]